MFQDREQAGRHLAAALQTYIKEDAIVVALPRGGVPVGFDVAKAFQIPLYVLVARKIGAPGQKELGVGAVAEEGVIVLDRPSIYDLQISPVELENTIEKEQKELLHRVETYRHGKPLPDFFGKTVVLVDDGLATGVTARAAIESLQKHHASTIIFAAPVCAQSTARELKRDVDSVICLHTPENLYAVGMYYQNFSQISDEQVVALMERARNFGKDRGSRSYH